MASAPQALLSVALALLAGAPAAAAAQTGPPPPTPAPPAEESWQPGPGFYSGWARGGFFLPSGSDFADGRTTATLGVGFGVRLLPFATAGVEASWTDRDFADPGGAGSRISLESRGLAALVRLHHAFWRLEPGLTAGAVWLESRLAGSSNGLDGTARGFGFVAGAGVDLLVVDGFAVGVDWRWLQASGRFPDRHGASMSLAGQSVGGLVRLALP